MLKKLSNLCCALMVFAALSPGQALPPVKHIFIIVLENKSYTETFGPTSPAPYLSKTLTAQGQLLTQYYGIGHESNPNYLAMISGQAPNTETQSDCQVYSDFVSTGVYAPYGQLTGQGCVFPTSVETIADQFHLHNLTWHGYMESMPTACSHPALNAMDTTQKATATSEYATRHNPFVYFHTIIDDPNYCASNDVPLTLLQTDLASAATTPNLVFITPDLCHDGHDSPCADGEPGGLVSADQFLRQWVPVIQQSPAYQEDGLLLITFDEADYGSDPTATQACCGEMPGPNSPLPGISGAGGGLTGTVALSRFIKPGSVNSTPYNHYALLKTMESIFGLPYLGYAQPPDLAIFGSDVFNNYRSKKK
jgi:phospholipase C